MFNKILTTVSILAVITTAFANTSEARYVTKGLVSYWSFDRNTISGDTVEDVDGDNDGTISGNPEVVAGMVKESLQFNGADDCIDLPASAINDFDSGTFEAWINLNSNNEETILAKQHNGVNSYSIFSVGYLANPAGWPDPNTAGKLYFHARNDFNASSSSTLNNGQWYHVVLTFDTSNANFYIDGSLDNTVEDDFNIPDDLNPTATSIGAWLGDGGGRYFCGAIDEVRIYNQALSDAEVRQNYTSGAVVNPTGKLTSLWGQIKTQ